MKTEFENYEHLEPIPKIYGYCGTLASFFGFLCLEFIVKRTTPVFISEGRQWKWQNILMSWCHSAMVGILVLYSFYQYPEAAWDLIAFHNPLSYGIVAFSTGYFFCDFLHIVWNSQAASMWEVLLHHVAVLSIFLYNLTLCRYIGYTSVALLVEVHSISLHLRKLMQMAGVSFQNKFYRLNNVINIVLFVGFRFPALAWITTALPFSSHRMSTIFVCMLSTTMFVMWVINLILFWRLIKSDFLRNLEKQRPAADNSFHRNNNNNNNSFKSSRKGKLQL